MTRAHAFALSVLLGLALVFGAFALVRTTHLGSSARSASNARITAESRKLDATARRLRAALAQASAPLPRSAASAPVAQRTVYVRPAPRIVHLHRSGEGGDVAERGGFDD